jgi:glycosyltransferase involved in cell wall biosynthesis
MTRDPIPQPMKLLFIAAEFPYPPWHGGRADTWQRLKAFVAAGAQVQLVCWTSARRGGAPTADQLATVQALVADLVVLPIHLSPADLAWRALNLVRMPSHASARLPWGRQRRALMARVAGFDAGAVWVDGLWAAGLGRWVAQAMGWPYFYRSHNIEHRYMAAQARLADGLMYRLRLQANLLGLRRYETATVLAAQELFDISVDDLAFWQQRGLVGGQWLPPYVPTRPAPVPLPEPDGAADAAAAPRFDAAYIGNLHTPNNVEAVAWLLQAVWPLLLARRPQATLLLAGYAPSARVQALARAAAGVTLLADPPDVWSLYAAARVLVNPARTGSGVNIKSVEMLQLDRPVVSTGVGVAGLPPTIRAQFCVADDAPGFAAALVAALDQPVAVDAAGRAQARAAFDPATAALVLQAMAKARH